MKNVKGIDEKGRCTRAGKCGSNLGTHMSALSNARDNDLSMTAIDKFNGTIELFVESRYEVEHGLCFVADGLYGVVSW